LLAVAELEVPVGVRLAEVRLGHIGAIHVDPILGLVARSALGTRNGLGGGRRRQRCADKSQGNQDGKPFHRMFSFIIIFKRRFGARRYRMVKEARVELRDARIARCEA
jgi:hypothetical protein